MAQQIVITQELVRQLLDYDALTGVFTWKARTPERFAPGIVGSDGVCRSWNSKHAGKPALRHVNSEGYLTGAIWGQTVKAHRIACLWMTGRYPEEVDHLDGNRANNTWSNLCPATKRANQRNRKLNGNNTSGRVGVYFYRKTGRWVALIAGRYIGVFGTHSEACRARSEAEQALGFSKRHGSCLPDPKSPDGIGQ